MNYKLLKNATMEELARFHIYHVKGVFIGLSHQIRYTPDDVFKDNIDWLNKTPSEMENNISE